MVSIHMKQQRLFCPLLEGYIGLRPCMCQAFVLLVCQLPASQHVSKYTHHLRGQVCDEYSSCQEVQH